MSPSAEGQKRVRPLSVVEAEKPLVAQVKEERWIAGTKGSEEGRDESGQFGEAR